MFFDRYVGDFENAIETLETAMSLLRQSKVASDDRVKVQISSLQDTLCGIEANRYKHSSRRERGDTIILSYVANTIKPKLSLYDCRKISGIPSFSQKL